MKVSSRWIKNHLSRTMLTDMEVVKALERAGMEVEQISSSMDIDSHVVTALVKKVMQHPNADRLHLAEVAVGDQTFHVVCGAPNLEEGMRVAFAQIGTILPSGDRIEKAKLRGEISEGMLCSALELGLGKDHAGLLRLPDDAEIGVAISTLFPSDSVIDLKTPANRFDVQSVLGLAREVAAMTGHKLAKFSPPIVNLGAHGPNITSDAKAQRYLLARVSIDQSVPTTPLMAAYLRSSGMRSISPIVDVTNYVMLETGQPLHAFDAATVELPISVRYATSGEKLETLDGVLRNLTTEDLIIADLEGPLALAGVMGGARSEVTGDTSEILLESAVFDAATVRKMAKRHGLRTEASARFERGLPMQLPELALQRAIELLAQIANGEYLGGTDVCNMKPTSHAISFHTGWLSNYLGFGITTKQILQALARLEIDATVNAANRNKDGKVHNNKETDDNIEVAHVPWWRPDLVLREDLAEEIIRVVGYNKLPATLPAWKPKRLEIDTKLARRRNVRELLYGAGLFEVMTYSFVSADQLSGLSKTPEDHLKLLNPLSIEQAYLRSDLLASHLAVLERNRLYAPKVGFFEIANVFIPEKPSELPREPLKMAVTMVRPNDVYKYVKGVLDAIEAEFNLRLRVEGADSELYASGRGAAIYLDQQRVGHIGQVRPVITDNMKISGEVGHFEVDLDVLLAVGKIKQFKGLQRFPTITRDISVLIPVRVSWQEIQDGLPHQQVAFINDYYGSEIEAGFKVVTLRLVVSHPDRTPTDLDANQQETKILTLLARAFGAQRRQVT